MTFTKLPKAISAEELLSTPLPPVKWIIPGLLPAGLALFAGPSKAGKSWLTLWLCLQIAQGNPVWDREIEPRTVIYFSLEDTFNRLQNRIFQLIDGGGCPRASDSPNGMSEYWAGLRGTGRIFDSYILRCWLDCHRYTSKSACERWKRRDVCKRL